MTLVSKTNCINLQQLNSLLSYFGMGNIFSMENDEQSLKDLHCYIDDTEVSMGECDGDSKDEREEEKANKIPEPSLLVTIIIERGNIVERVYMTPEGEKIRISCNEEI